MRRRPSGFISVPLLAATFPSVAATGGTALGDGDQSVGEPKSFLW